MLPQKTYCSSDSHSSRRTARRITIVLMFAGTLVIADEQSTEAGNAATGQEPITPIPLTVTVDEDKAQLGESLFYDTRLSKDNHLACASCHQLESGGDDNVAKSLSQTEDAHVMNTPTVFNARYNFRQNWDGSAATLGDQIEMVFANHDEFNTDWNSVISALKADSDLADDFNKNYKQGITKDNIIDALVEYEKTLITPNSRFDRFLRNEENVLSKEEIEGYKLFKALGCISCHQGRNIGGNLFQKFGVFYNYIAERGDITERDYGKFNITNREIDRFVFKVPSLRNIAATSPYLHDGSAKTIEDAIRIMGKTQLGKILTESEILSIKKFLNTLTGEYKSKPLDTRS